MANSSSFTALFFEGFKLVFFGPVILVLYFCAIGFFFGGRSGGFLYVSIFFFSIGLIGAIKFLFDPEADFDFHVPDGTAWQRTTSIFGNIFGYSCLIVSGYIARRIYDPCKTLVSKLRGSA